MMGIAEIIKELLEADTHIREKFSVSGLLDGEKAALKEARARLQEAITALLGVRQS